MYGVYAYNYLSGGDEEYVEDQDGKKVHVVNSPEYEKYLLYSPALASKGYVFSEAKLTKETNKAGSFVFTMPKTHPVFSDGFALSKLKTLIIVKKSDEEIWRGRILDEEKDFYGSVKITCEGELAFLNDIVIKPKTYGKKSIEYWLKTVIGKMYSASTGDYLSGCYTDYCSPYRKIVVGEVNNTEFSGKLTSVGTSEYMTAFNALQSVLIDVYGGYLTLERDPTTDFGVLSYYSNDIETVKNTEIVFGRSLLDLSQYIDATNVYTGIIPTATNDDDDSSLSISDFTLSSSEKEKYFISGGCLYSKAATEEFGKIARTVNFQNVASGSVLKKYAIQLLDKAAVLSASITISAVDLSLLGAEYDSIDVNDTVYVTSLPHGIYREGFRCKKVETNILNPGNSVYTIGYIPETLTAKQLKLNNKIGS